MDWCKFPYLVFPHIQFWCTHTCALSTHPLVHSSPVHTLLPWSTHTHSCTPSPVRSCSGLIWSVLWNFLILCQWSLDLSSQLRSLGGQSGRLASRSATLFCGYPNETVLGIGMWVLTPQFIVSLPLLLYPHIPLYFCVYMLCGSLERFQLSAPSP